MKKTYTITFKAELTEDDLKAMQGCFYQAMNESMEISEVWGLEIKEDKEDDFLEPNNGFYHIHDCVDALMACETIEEVHALLGSFPNKFGEWWVDVVGEGEDAYYEVTNEWWDEQYEELNSRTFDLEIEVEEEDEE
jgi:hypothetical protein